MPNPSINKRVILSGISLDADAMSIIANFTTPISPAQKQAINSFVVGLKSNGLFGLIDSMFVFGAPNESGALQNWKSPTGTQASKVNAPTWSISGYVSNGTTSYINTGYNINGGSGFTQNSCSFHAYNQTNSISTGSLGGVSGIGQTVTAIYDRFTGDITLAFLTRGATTVSYANTSSQGLHSLTRNSSTVINALLKGVNKVSGGSQTSGALATSVVYACATRDITAAAAANFTTHGVSLIAWGGYMTDAQVLTFNNLIQTYFTVLGIAV
jgi:hypothetical protein